MESLPSQHGNVMTAVRYRDFEEDASIFCNKRGICTYDLERIWILAYAFFYRTPVHWLRLNAQDLGTLESNVYKHRQKKRSLISKLSGYSSMPTCYVSNNLPTNTSLLTFSCVLEPAMTVEKSYFNRKRHVQSDIFIDEPLKSLSRIPFHSVRHECRIKD